MAGGITTDDPHWRRTTGLSAGLAAVAAVAASETQGLGRTLCIVVAFVVGLPALSTAFFLAVGLLLTAVAGPAETDGQRRRMDKADAQRRRIDKAEVGRRRRDKADPEDKRRAETDRPDPRRRRARFALVGLALVSGAGGAVWYAWAPGVGSYQVSVLFMLPTLAVALIWIHRRIAVTVQWVLAFGLAPVGPIGYLVVGGAEWWNWGQLTALPLVILVGARGAGSTEAGRSPWYGGFRDGPWGPP